MDDNYNEEKKKDREEIEEIEEFEEDKEYEPRMGIIDRKLVKYGGSVTVSIPPEWLEQHGYKEGDKVTLMLNSDLKVLSPKSRNEFYKNAFKKHIEKNE